MAKSKNKGKIVKEFSYPKMDEYKEILEITKDASSKYDCKDSYESALIENNRLKKEIEDLEEENKRLAKKVNKLKKEKKGLKNTLKGILITNEQLEKHNKRMTMIASVAMTYMGKNRSDSNVGVCK